MKKLVALDYGEGNFINVNFPDCRVDDVAGVEITQQGKRDQNFMVVDERMDNRGEPYFWMSFKRDKGVPPHGTDLAAVFARKISITPLHMNLTQAELLIKLRSAF